MAEFHINDQWILDRVSNQSSSFKGWIDNLIQTIQKSVQESHPEVAEKLKKNKQDIPDLMALDEKIKLAEQKVNQVTKNLGNFGSLGGFMSDLMSNIQNQVMQSIQAKMPSSFPNFDINLDFLTGKQKNLAKTLYDVAKERGIKSEGILYLIKSLPDLESFLYSTSAGKYYRDHTEHQLRVAVLGDFLLEQDLGQGSLLSHIADLTELDKNLIKEKIWWFMGLVHDIGYPLQKMALSINYSLLNQILKSYPMLDFDVVPFEIFLPSKNINPYLPFLEEGLSKQAKLLIRNGLGLNLTSLPKPKARNFLASESGHKEYVHESEIKLDHGAIGALNVLKSLGSPEDIKAHYDEFIGYIKAAQAIALHNFKEQLSDYIFDNNPLAFLLVLLDEMQEWGRPVPIQIYDSYFTTELKKITLLDEIILSIDEVQWLMAFKKTQAKEITSFKFNQLCMTKESAFKRLQKGKEFPETLIVLQDFDISESVIPTSSKGLKEVTPKQVKSTKERKKIIDDTIAQEIHKELSEDERKKISEKVLSEMGFRAQTKQEKLLAEFKITI